MKYGNIVGLTLVGLWLACVPMPNASDNEDPGRPTDQVPDGTANDNDNGSEPEPPGPSPAWPAPESPCETDQQCEAGLFCEPLGEDTLAAFLDGMSPGDIPPDTPLEAGQAVCQTGCRIDDVFYTPGERGAPPDDCGSCQPDVSTTEWTALPAGETCDDGLFCTSGSGVPGDVDRCDEAGACVGDPVSCDDGLFCTGSESCNEDTDACESTGDPCPGTECNTCQEDTDTCFEPVGSPCGDPRDVLCDDPDTCDGSGTCQPNYWPSLATCRSAAGPCDVPENCNGAGACRANVFKPQGTVCNPGSGDMCDPDEVCSGNSADCPADTFEPGTTVCNEGSGDLCDPDELCPGVPDQKCPDDSFEPSTTVCNEGSGDMCDPDELCPGVADQGCPADIFKPATTVCNEGSGDMCDPDELCPGVADQGCPADRFEPSTTVCNAGSGDMCDPDELCPGAADRACPDDSVAPKGTVCNAGSGDLCDRDELCSGVAGQPCPADRVEPSTTSCRAAAGDCDVEEFCPGAADAACPADQFRPATTVCRFSRGFCDDAELCTGQGPDCPDDVLKPAGTVCRPIGGVCDTAAEVCSGDHPSCPLNVDSYPGGELICREAVGPCDEAEVCRGTPDSWPNCPPDVLKPAGTVCRPAFPVIFPIRAACGIAEVCDGLLIDCPPDERIPEGGACTFDGGTGTCEDRGGPFLQCIVRGDTPNGGACTNDSDCQSLHCGDTRDIGRVCMAENEVGFGETCDGDGFHLAGDPNGRSCTSRGGFLNCCRAGNLPNTGETGTCQGCCRDDDLSGGLAIGCDSGEIPICCSGRCTDGADDPTNCGDCGNNCFDYVGPCLPEVLSCGYTANNLYTPGVCQLSFACGAGQVCQDPCDICWFYGNCDTCVPTAHCITLVVPGTGTLCEDCSSDDDCTGSEQCFSGCGGSFADIFCVAPNYCAEDPDQCGG